MSINPSSIKVYFVSERNDVNKIRLCYNDDWKSADLQSGTYVVVDIQKAQNINVYLRRSGLESLLDIWGFPLVGKFVAKPGGFYEIRYCRKGLGWKAVAREVGPF